MPIVTQFLSDPEPETIDRLVGLANRPGRLGIVVETLKVASRLAAKANATLADEHIQKADDLRRRMAGNE